MGKGTERRTEMAKRVTLGRVGSKGKHRGFVREGRTLSPLTYAVAAFAILSVTSNLVVFFKFQRGGTPLHGFNDSDNDFPGEAEEKPQSKSTDSVVINLNHGDPTMFEPFWRAMGERGAMVVPAWQTMSYFSRAETFCWFMEPRLTREIIRLHRIVGNARTDDRHVIVGTGSTQLFQAALYALSSPEPFEPISVVSAAPFYSSYPAVTNYLRSELYTWAGDARSFHGDGPYIELVCSPNNPDGSMMEPVVNREKGKTIHDLAYYWPHFAPITAAASHDLMLFTFSKITGHAGTRIGWALVKDKEVAEKMTKFIELNTIGVSKDSQLRAARILREVSDGYELERDVRHERFFDFGRRLMAERWDRLRKAIRPTGHFSVPDYASAVCNFTGEITPPLPGFAWLRCENEGANDCEEYLKRLGILTRSGKHFGWGPNYTRVSMLDSEENFNIFMQRILSVR